METSILTKTDEQSIKSTENKVKTPDYVNKLPLLFVAGYASAVV